MYTQITSALISLLSDSLKGILSPGQVGLYLPHERGEITLGLYLYSIRDCTEMGTPDISAVARNVRAMPPRFVTLHYLMTAYSKSEVAHRATDDCRILEAAMQVFEDNPVLNEKNLGFKPGSRVNELKLEFVDLPHAEIAGIWEHQDVPYRLSAAYRVMPVELSRGLGRISERVEEVQSNFEGIE